MPQPARASLPVRSASLPPIHLTFDEADHELEPDNHGRPNLVTVAKTDNVPFPWDHLPKEIQQSILHKALVPSDMASPALAIGKPAHREHMRNTAIPILLGLGTWAAYIAAARILYSEVHLILFRYPDAAMQFLTSPTTLRPRRFVGKLQLHINIEDDLCLFDDGWRATTSVPEARVNIPTALHSMRVHGRLRKVHFLLDVPEILYHREPDPMTGKERTVSAYYLPMARLQLAHGEEAVWDSPGTGSSRAVQPGREVIAPAFLAGRAFQYGLLPLLEDGVTGKSSLSLEVISKDGKSRVEGTDAGRLFRYWLGATILEVLNETKAVNIARGKWVDPFAVARRAKTGGQTTVLQQGEADGDEQSAATHVDGGNYHDFVNTKTPGPEAHRGVTHLPTRPDELIGYKSRVDDLLLSSPIKYDSPTPSSVTSGEYVTMDLDACVPTAAAEDDDKGECEVDRDPDVDDALQSHNSIDESDLFGSCLETVISHTGADKAINSLEESQKFDKASSSISPCDRVDADNKPAGDEVPLEESIHCPDHDKPAVIESVGSGHPAPPSLNFSHDTDSDSNSNCHLDRTASEDEYSPSQSIAFNRKRPSPLQDTGNDASSVPRDSDEGSRSSSSSSSSASSGSNDHMPATPTVEVPSYLVRPKPNNLASARDYGDSSSSSDSDSSSSSSDDDIAGMERGVLANSLGSSNSERNENVGARATGETGGRSGSAVRHKDAATQPAENQGIRSQPALSISPSPPSTRSTVQGESMQILPATPTTAFRPVNEPVQQPSYIATKTPSQPLSARAQPKDSSTTGQKRKALHDAPEAAKMSKNARRRANRRARLIARMAEDV